MLSPGRPFNPMGNDNTDAANWPPSRQLTIVRPLSIDMMAL